MPWSKFFITALYVFAAVLPIVAAVSIAWPKLGFARRVKRVARPDGEVSNETAGLLMNQQQQDVIHTGRALCRDISLAAAGLLAGAVASIWSLFI